MTAKMWEEYFRDPVLGAAVRFDVTDVLRDLAACEAERDRLRAEVEDYRVIYDTIPDGTIFAGEAAKAGERIRVRRQQHGKAK